MIAPSGAHGGLGQLGPWIHRQAGHLKRGSTNHQIQIKCSRGPATFDHLPPTNWRTQLAETSFRGNLAKSIRRISMSSRLVMTANIVASLGLAAAGLMAGTTVLAVTAIVLAIDMATFAASQALR